MDILSRSEIIEVAYSNKEEFIKHRVQLEHDGWIHEGTLVDDTFSLVVTYKRGISSAIQSVRTTMLRSGSKNVVVRNAYNTVLYEGSKLDLFDTDVIGFRLIMNRSVMSVTDSNGILNIVVR